MNRIIILFLYISSTIYSFSVDIAQMFSIKCYKEITLLGWGPDLEINEIKYINDLPDNGKIQRVEYDANNFVELTSFGKFKHYKKSNDDLTLEFKWDYDNQNRLTKYTRFTHAHSQFDNYKKTTTYTISYLEDSIVVKVNRDGKIEQFKLHFDSKGRVLGFSKFRVSYDSYGKILSNGNTQFTYDHQGRIESVVYVGSKQKRIYDGHGATFKFISELWNYKGQNLMEKKIINHIDGRDMMFVKTYKIYGSKEDEVDNIPYRFKVDSQKNWIEAKVKASFPSKEYIITRTITYF